MTAPLHNTDFDNLVNDLGGKTRPGKLKTMADSWKPYARYLKTLKISGTAILTITLVVATTLMARMLLPLIYNTKMFGYIGGTIGATATFMAMLTITYTVWRISQNRVNIALIFISAIHILSWSVIASILIISSNTTLIDTSNSSMSISTIPMENYGGGVIGDSIAIALINGSLHLFEAIHPAIILPTAFMLISSIFLGNPFSYIGKLMNMIFPSETGKNENISTTRVKTIDKKPNNALVDVLDLYGFEAKIKGEPQVGPSITRHKLQLQRGAKTKQLESLSKDIARDLKLKKIYIDTAGDGDGTINIETENTKRDIIYLRDLLNSDIYLNAPRRSVILGVNAANKQDVIVKDLHDMPHLLVAGTTGGGKSVGVNAMLISLLYKNSPEQIKLILLDPKLVELTPYNSLPHLLLPVETNPKNVPDILDRAIAEMEYRYALMAANGVRSIDELNKKIKSGKRVVNPLYSYRFADRSIEHENDAFNHQPFSETHHQLLTKFIPDIVIVADEFADMMKIAGEKIEEKVDRLAAKARASNIIEVLATQRPTVKVITGNIKANIPSRLAFSVPVSKDSETILGRKDAKDLLGQGDSFFMEQSDQLLRIQSPFSSDEEVARFISTGSLAT